MIIFTAAAQGFYCRRSLFIDAYKSVLAGIGAGRKVRTIYLTPQGRTFHQGMAQELAQEEDLIFFVRAL